MPVEEIQLGIRHGVRKINVDTDSRLAITGAIRKELIEHPEEFDPRSLPEARARGDAAGDRGADDGVRPGRARRRLRADPARGDARALPQRRPRVSLAGIDAGLRAAGRRRWSRSCADRLGWTRTTSPPPPGAGCCWRRPPATRPRASPRLAGRARDGRRAGGAGHRPAPDGRAAGARGRSGRRSVAAALAGTLADDPATALDLLAAVLLMLEADSSAAADERHLRRHHRHELHVRVERQRRHVDDRRARRARRRTSARARVEPSAWRTPSCHPRGHLGAGVADVDLAAGDVVRAAVERGRLREPGDRVLRGRVGRGAAAAATWPRSSRC